MTKSPRHFLVEYTRGTAKKSHFEKVHAETPSRASELFVERTVNTYVAKVWTLAIGREEAQ